MWKSECVCVWRSSRVNWLCVGSNGVNSLFVERV